MQTPEGDVESVSQAETSPRPYSQDLDHVTPGNEGREEEENEGMEIVEEEVIEAESEDQVEASLSGMMKGVVNKIAEAFQSHSDEPSEVTAPHVQHEWLNPLNTSSCSPTNLKTS